MIQSVDSPMQNLSGKNLTILENSTIHIEENAERKWGID